MKKKITCRIGPTHAYEHLDRFKLRDEGFQRTANYGLSVTNTEERLPNVYRDKIEVPYDGEIVWPYSRNWYIKDPMGYEIEAALWADDRAAFDPV